MRAHGLVIVDYLASAAVAVAVATLFEAQASWGYGTRGSPTYLPQWQTWALTQR